MAWEFDANTRVVDVDRWYQRAVKRFGATRVALFGEAAMFTAQSAGPVGQWLGLGSPGAEQNQHFLLKVAHWLSGILPGSP